jgi:hypothetical protein
MKRYFLVLLACLVASGVRAQNGTYLHTLKPIKENNYSTFANSSNFNTTMGGVTYRQGFAIHYQSGTSDDRKQGYVEFKLGKKYSTLQFILGTTYSYANANTSGVLVIQGDGKNLLDKVVQYHSIPTVMTLDVTDVDVLRFEQVKGEINFGFAEPTLWTKGQTPVLKASTSTVKGDKPVHLVSELRPYYVDNYHTCVSSYSEDKVRSLSIAGKTYNTGLIMNAYQRLVGNGRATTLFNLDGKFKTLSMVAGMKDLEAGSGSSGWITIIADGKTIYEEEFKEGDLSQQVKLDIEGCRQLRIESEQTTGSSILAVADMVVYPAGQEPSIVQQSDADAIADPRLKSLPDVCKLISNIPPHAMTGKNMEENLFDGKSSHVTFSMGGTRFNEGFILYSSTSIMNDNTRSRVHFNLGGEFDYISFTSGWVSKCGVLKNDTLRIYADDRIVFNMPLIATNPNKDYVVPIYKCHKLTFEERGMVSMEHPAYGVADIVVYRGEPVENNLFPHPIPDLPDEQELCSLGQPYIYHSTFGLNLDNEKASSLKYRFLDGSTKKEYFDLDGKRVYSGFALRTSVHFDLEAGMGGEGAGAAVVAAGMGASLMIGTVGNMTISAVCPFGSLLMLAAGGDAHEVACAAFNTYGAYDELTFTVSSYTPAHDIHQREKLKIGGDGEVLQEYQISSDMQSTTFTLPIKKCKQLMFWLECGDNSSGIYLFHDLMLRKTNSPRSSVSGGAQGVSSHAGAIADAEPYTLPVESFQRQFIEWKRPNKCGVDVIDDYLIRCENVKRRIELFLGMDNAKVTKENRINSYRPITVSTYDHMTDAAARVDYHTSAVYVTATDGQNYRSISLETDQGDIDFRAHRERNIQIIRAAKGALNDIVSLKIDQATATVGLVELGLSAITFRKNITAAADVINNYKEQLEALIADKEAENERIDALLRSAITLDGVQSTPYSIFVK